jgi:tRNA pseudouridine38-40 synthase
VPCESTPSIGSTPSATTKRRSKRARGFLHHQFRSMVGSLVDVGSGRSSATDLEAALKAVDRSRCGQVAPASGLYLTRVDYSEYETGRKSSRSENY